MKVQLDGILNIHIINAKQLGFQNVNNMHLKLISTMILAKLMTSIKAIITCLGIPIIQKENQIKYINPKLTLVNLHGVHIMLPDFENTSCGNVHMNHSIEFEIFPFKEYFKKIETCKNKFLKNLSILAKTKLEIICIKPTK
jgi:hypothetical protein